MKRVIKKYKEKSYEERLIITATVTMSVSLIIAVGKALIGLFFDPVMLAVGLFNLMLMIAKLSCIIGAKKGVKFKKRNTYTAVFLFLGGILYILYMSAGLRHDMPTKEYSMTVAILIATIAFTEMGLAIYGLAKTKEKGHDYRNIKIIAFVSALIAIMTAQIALLSFSSEEDMTVYNSFTGIGIGVITALLSIYIYFAPEISIIDREHNVFILGDPSRNTLVDMTLGEVDIKLKKSRIYGDYIYRAKIDGDTLDGHIIKNKYFWKRLHILLKILVIVLSEILIFAWLIGYAFYFVSAINMPKKLCRLMENNGFSLDNKDAETNL